MTGFGHPSAPQASLRSPRLSVVGVHVMHLSDLYQWRTGIEQTARHRVPVHMLALVTAGRASFSVDFAPFGARPGGLLWVRPDQFVGFPPPGVDATLILFEPTFPYGGESGPAGDRWAGPGTYWQLTGDDEEAIVDGVSQLEADYRRVASGDPLPLDVLRHQLAALLLRVAHLEPEGRVGQAGVDSEVLRRLRSEIESRFRDTRQVEHYARALDCSVRTLTRASLATTGRTAKQLIDDRVALEAKRLLAESDLPVSVIGARLGFREATNFGRFFARTVGVSPGNFRAQSRREAAESGRAVEAPPAAPLATAVAKGERRSFFSRRQ